MQDSCIVQQSGLRRRTADIVAKLAAPLQPCTCVGPARNACKVIWLLHCTCFLTVHWFRSASLSLRSTGTSASDQTCYRLTAIDRSTMSRRQVLHHVRKLSASSALKSCKASADQVQQSASTSWRCVQTSREQGWTRTDLTWLRWLATGATLLHTPHLAYSQQVPSAGLHCRDTSGSCTAQSFRASRCPSAYALLAFQTP